MSEPIDEPAAAHAPADRYAVLRIRDFQLYLMGRFVASLGQQMLGMAVGWELYERTGSALALGYVGLAQIVPLVLLTLPAGHIADQRDRRSIVLVMQVIFAVAAVGLALISWFQAPVPWSYFFLFLSGLAQAFLWPASSAFLPQIVPRAQFPQAVTWISSTFQLSATLGPALGGLIIARTQNAAIVYTLDAIGWVACFALVTAIRSRTAAPAVREKMTIASLRAGFRFVLESKIIVGTITLDMVAVLLGGSVALLPLYAKDILKVGADRLGWLQAALPLGSMLMALWLAHRPPMRRAGRNLMWAVGGFGVATIIFGLSHSFWLSLAMMFACGALDNISVIVRSTLVQVLTPDAMRGRVSAVNMLFIGTSNEFGSFESGTVANFLGPIPTVVLGGIGTIVTVVATNLVWPEIGRVRRLDQLTAPERPEEIVAVGTTSLP